MNRQSLIDSFFKVKANSSQNLPKVEVKCAMEKNVRKRSLSLKKPATPPKAIKVSIENQKEVLSSDEGEIPQVPCIDLTQLSNDSENLSDCSENTIICSPNKSLQSPSTTRKLITPTTPRKEPLGTQEFLGNNNSSSQENTNRPVITETSGQTPQKTTQAIKTPNKCVSSIKVENSQELRTQRSPSSKTKYFSPIKKRTVSIRPTNKVKRSLNNDLSGASFSSRIMFEDEIYANACEGMDDKTKFLLEIINKYLETPSLRRLLDEESQTLLSRCFQVVKPGMRLVYRLYWRKEGWRTKEQLTKILSEEKEPPDDLAFQTVMDSLVENELAEQSRTDNITFDQYMNILKKDDLMTLCKELKLNINSTKNKNDCVDALKKFSNKSVNISHFFTGCTSSNSERVLKMLSSKVGICYKLSQKARNTLYKLYIIMYLGMDYSIIREKKLELTLIFDKINRETYPIDKTLPLDDASVIFKSKDEFDRYLTSHDIYEEFISSTDNERKCALVKQVFTLYKAISNEEMERYKQLPCWLHRFTPPSKYLKILEAGVQDLKRDKQGGHYLLSLEILNTLIGQETFRQHHRAEWFAEKALILHNCLSRSDEAAEVLLEGFRSDLSEEAKDTLRPRAKKIALQKNITLNEELRHELLAYATKETIQERSFPNTHMEKLPMERSTVQRGRVRFETRTAEGRQQHTAEQYAIAEYIHSQQYTHGEHWEGQIISTLFFLLFWDIIYSRGAGGAGEAGGEGAGGGGGGGARGLFLSHFQLFPLDMFTDSFYKNRREAIDKRLKVIKAATEEQVVHMMQITWDSRPEHQRSGVSSGVSWEKARAVASCLGGARLAALCARLATDYGYSHSGFPDLTLWHQHTRQIKFVEVKTDTDKPSIKQLQWMQYLRENNIDVEFCYVGRHTTRQRARAPRPAPHTPRPAPHTPRPARHTPRPAPHVS